MTDMELDKLETLASAATPGKWHTVVTDNCYVLDAGDYIICETSGICGANKDAEYIAAANPAVIQEMIADLKKARADACEWISIARWLARELGKDSIPETEWIILARQALGYKNEWGDGEPQNGFRIYSALEPCHLTSNSCSVPPQEATCMK